MRIGFVDHHLNNFHANKFLTLLHGPLANLDARVEIAWESHPTGEDWCEKNGVTRAGSAEAVAEHTDAVIVLAPDNIDAHLELCRKVLPAGRPTVVDKFLAPDVKQAEQIIRLARESGAPIFSSSSLRFAVELEAALAEAKEARTEAFARGMGAWDGYGVHTLALVIGALGGDALPERVINTGSATSAVVTLECAGGRRGWVDVRTAANEWDAFPWTFGFRSGDRYVTGTVKDFDGFYANLMRRAVEFFRTGKSPLSTAEMLRTVAVLEAANRPRGAWISL
jgi:predicted dehydrogenase